NRIVGATMVATLGGPASARIRRFEAAGLRRKDAWCAVSDHVARLTITAFDISGEPPTRIHSGVEVPDIPREFADEKTVVFGGTIKAEKGILELLRAWPAVRAAVPATLHLFGGFGTTIDRQPIVPRIEALVPDPDTAGVVFHGRVQPDELHAAYARASVSVFPSLADAFPLAMVEAMAVGSPTIGSCLGPGAEVIDDGVDGWVVDPTDASALADAIVRALADQQLAEAIGHRAKERVARDFTIARWTERTTRFYDEVLRSWRPNRSRSRVGR
ncbi:MAG: glycosyltransferase family 4 protein, partial [Actinomycetota bacterium]